MNTENHVSSCRLRTGVCTIYQSVEITADVYVYQVCSIAWNSMTRQKLGTPGIRPKLWTSTGPRIGLFYFRNKIESLRPFSGRRPNLTGLTDPTIEKYRCNDLTSPHLRDLIYFFPDPTTPATLTTLLTRPRQTPPAIFQPLST